MKKILVFLLVAIFVFTLTACGEDNSGKYSADDGKVQDSQNESDNGSGNQNSENNSSDNMLSDIMGSDDNKNQDNNASSEKSSSGANTPSSSGGVVISKDEALSIALKNANISKEKVTRIEIELDYEGTTPVWEIDFDHGKTEYSYTINAETGKIIERDKDLDF